MSIVKKTCFSNPELVTVGIQRVQKEIKWTNPCIEGFRHIGSDVFATFVLPRTPFLLVAEVVLAMEEIDESVPDTHEVFGSPLLDKLLKVTHIVVYEDVWLHIAHGHNILQEFCLVSVTLIGHMLLRP